MKKTLSIKVSGIPAQVTYEPFTQDNGEIDFSFDLYDKKGRACRWLNNSITRADVEHICEEIRNDIEKGLPDKNSV
jgi:hypothetical protein